MKKINAIFLLFCMFFSFTLDTAVARETTSTPLPKVIVEGRTELLDSSLTGAWKEELERFGIDTGSKAFQNSYVGEIKQINSTAKKIPLRKIFQYSSRGKGCDYSPDGWGAANFRPACDKHDYCYSKKSKTNRSVCDKQFLANLLSACTKAYRKDDESRHACNGVSSVYYGAVRLFGSGHYEGKGRND